MISLAAILRRRRQFRASSNTFPAQPARPKSLLLALPTEIRLNIYGYLCQDFAVKINLRRLEKCARISHPQSGILQTNRLLRQEALPSFSSPTYVVICGNWGGEPVEISPHILQQQTRYTGKTYDFSVVTSLEVHGRCRVAGGSFPCLARLTIHSSEIAFNVSDIFNSATRLPEALRVNHVKAGLVRQIQLTTFRWNSEIIEMFEDRKRTFELVVAHFGIYRSCNICGTNRACMGICRDIVRISVDYELDMDSMKLIKKAFKRDVPIIRDRGTGLCRKSPAINIV